MTYTYDEKLKLARQAKAGDKWVNIKTGRVATILGTDFRNVELQHQSGRITKKQDHYFAYDFDPVQGDAPAAASSEPTNFAYCAAQLKTTGAPVSVSKKNGVITVTVSEALKIEFRPSPCKKGGGVWKLQGANQNRGHGIRHAMAFIKNFRKSAAYASAFITQKSPDTGNLAKKARAV